MSLPRKKRRRIHVAGEDYYWTARPVHRQGYDKFDSCIMVQSASGVGHKLRIELIGLIKPSNVRAAIEFAHSAGWSPDCGADMEIGCDAFVDPVHFHTCPARAEEYWFIDRWFAANPNAFTNEWFAAHRDVSTEEP